jgi:hypothetical protein
VQPGGGPRARGKQGIELLERSTAHEGECAPERVPHALQKRREGDVDDDGVGRGCDVQEGAVDVEEQAPRRGTVWREEIDATVDRLGCGRQDGLCG